MDCFYLTINFGSTVLKYHTKSVWQYFTFLVCFESFTLSKQSFHTICPTLFYQLAVTFHLRSTDGIHTDRLSLGCWEVRRSLYPIRLKVSFLIILETIFVYFLFFSVSFYHTIDNLTFLYIFLLLENDTKRLRIPLYFNNTFEYSGGKK